MKKTYYLIIVLILCGLSVIIVNNYHTKGKLPKESSNGDAVELADSKEPVYVFNLENYINTFKSSRQKYDYLKAAFAIQGLVNRAKPRLYYIYENNGFAPIDKFWKTELFEKDGGDLSGTDTKTIDSFEEIIKYAKEDLKVINGFVLWDESVPASSNVASTIAGVENLVPIRYDTSPNSFYKTYANIIGNPNNNKNLVGLFSSKNDAYLWAKREYLDTGKTSKEIMGYVRDSWRPIKGCNREVCLIESSSPEKMKPNAEKEISVTLFNNTTETWTRDDNYRIALVNADAFRIVGAENGFEQGNGEDRAYLHPLQIVKHGAIVTISFTVKAPSTQGTYHLKLGVVHDGFKFFENDEKLSIAINVDKKASDNPEYKVKENYGSYNYIKTNRYQVGDITKEPIEIKNVLFNSGLNNSDYLIQKQAFFFDLSPDETIAPIDDRNQAVGTDVATLKAILFQQSINSGAKVFSVSGFVPWYIKYAKESDTKSNLIDVQSEWEFINIVSQFGGEIEADGMNPAGITNASIFSKVPLKYWDVNHDKKKSKISNYDPNTIYFMVYMGDYDGASWTSGVLPSRFNHCDKNSENKCDDKHPLAWPINIDLSNRIPHVYNWLNKNQNGNDYFVAGNNGTGYSNPFKYGNINTWKEHNKEMLGKFGIDVTGLLLSPTQPLTKNVVDAYSEMTPTLVGYQVDPKFEFLFEEGALNGTATPFVYVTNASVTSTQTLGANMIDAIKAVKENNNIKNNNFVIVRTIQVSRKQAYEAIEEVEEKEINGKKVKVVDPYTMAYLYKQANPQPGVQGATFARNACVSNGKTRQWIESGSIPSGYSLVSGVKSKDECESIIEEPLSGNGISDPTENIIGDVNGDREVNSLDYIQIRKHVIGTKKLTGDSYNRADMNGDTKVNSLDYIILRKQLINRK